MSTEKKKIYWGRHRTHELSDSRWDASDSLGDVRGGAPRHRRPGEVAHTYDHRAAIEECLTIEGVSAVAIVDLHTGTVLTRASRGDAEAFTREAAGHAEMVKAKVDTLVALGLEDEVEDILISTRDSYALVRPVTHAPSGWDLFFFMTLDRADANLAMARYRLARIDASLQL